MRWPALDSLREKDTQQTAQAALADEAPAVRAAARNVLARIEPDAAIPLLAAAAGCDALPSGRRPSPSSASSTRRRPRTRSSPPLDRLLAGELPADSRLDLLAAAAAERKEGEIKERLARYESQRAKDDPLAAWQECLEGGDAERGRTIFFERAQVSCVRCHKVGGTGGEVGPDLSKIAADKRRDYLLEAIVASQQDDRQELRVGRDSRPGRRHAHRRAQAGDRDGGAADDSRGEAA